MHQLFRLVAAAALASCAFKNPATPSITRADALGRMPAASSAPGSAPGGATDSASPGAASSSSAPAPSSPAPSCLAEPPRAVDLTAATAAASNPAAVSAAASGVSTPRGESLKRLPQRRVTRAIARAARAIIEEHGRAPLGTEIAFEAEGQPYVARIEQHYHPPGGPKRPWGPHPGVSVLVSAADARRLAHE